MVTAEKDPQSALGMLSPGIWYRLGEKDKGDAAKAELLPAASGEYKTWLEKLKP